VNTQALLGSSGGSEQAVEEAVHTVLVSISTPGCLGLAVFAGDPAADKGARHGLTEHVSISPWLGYKGRSRMITGRSRSMMDSIQSGNLVIGAQKDKLVFEIRGQGPGRAVVPLEDLPLILEFLNACNDTSRNRRVGFRLRLADIDPGELTHLSAALESAGGQWLEVKPVDLSIAGMHIDSPDFAGDYGDQVKVRLKWHGTAIDLPAVLVRRSRPGGTSAIQFTDIFDDDGNLEPPPGLKAIIHELELLWLEQHLSGRGA
jgi:hypothetical protein